MDPRIILEANLDEMIPGLVMAVRLRNIPKALEIIGKNIDALDWVSPSQDTLSLSKKAIPLLGYCAWAIDFHAPYFDMVEKSLPRFEQIPRHKLSVGELGLLDTAAGLASFHKEEYDAAKASFEKVKTLSALADDVELATVSRYYLSRVLWRQADYPQALVQVREAIERDAESGNSARVAAMQLVEGWLLLLLGDISESQQVLDRASKVLEKTDAWVDLGNVLSFQGRRYRKGGKYMEALESFESAIKVYEKHSPTHRNVARAYRNKAVVYRLLARELSDEPTTKLTRTQTEGEIKELRHKAVSALNQAHDIYIELGASRHTYELGILHITRAAIYSEAGRMPEAEAEAEQAYKYGDMKKNKIVMAEARVIQSKLALRRGELDDVRRAYELAKQAIELAKELVHHRRLLARAFISKAHALLDSAYNDPTSAHECWEQACLHLVPEDKDYLRNSLNSLEEKIRSKQGPSNGPIYKLTRIGIEGRALDELTSVFEETVIRDVYERSGRNILRTAEELKTGRRKVRNAVSTFKVTETTLKNLKREKVGDEALNKLAGVKNKEVYGRAGFVSLLERTTEGDLDVSRILKHVSQKIHH